MVSCTPGFVSVTERNARSAFGANRTWGRGVLHPLSSITGREMGKTPPVYRQHMRELIHILRNCSPEERQTHHTSSMSLCLTHDTPGRSRATSTHLPSPREIECCHPSTAFAEQRQGGSGTAQLPPCGTTGGQRQRPEGLPRLPIHAPSPSQQQETPAWFEGCWQSRRPAPTSCPGQPRAPLQENPLLPEPGSKHPAGAHHVWRLSTPATAGKWVAGLEDSKFPPPSDLLPSTASS